MITMNSVQIRPPDRHRRNNDVAPSPALIPSGTMPDFIYGEKPLKLGNQPHSQKVFVALMVDANERSQGGRNS